MNQFLELLNYATPDLIALIIIATGVALQSLVGIGYGLVAAPLLFLMNPQFIPSPILILGFFLSLLMVLRDRTQIVLRRVQPAILARMPGAILGAMLLSWVSLPVLQIFFGSALLFAVMVSALKLRLKLTPINLFAGGFCSGILGTATSVGGPPMALIYAHQPKSLARTDLGLFFLVGTPISLVALWLNGELLINHWLLSLKMLPGVWIGFYLSRYFDHLLNANRTKMLMFSFAGISGLVLIMKGVQYLMV